MMESVNAHRQGQPPTGEDQRRYSTGAAHWRHFLQYAISPETEF